MTIKFGATGTFSVSFGTSFTGYEFSIACEGGTVNLSVFKSTVTTIFRGKEEKVKAADEKTGLPPEVRKWGEALAAMKRNEKQILEEALVDLELVSGGVTIRGEKGADICAVGKHAQEQRGALELCISDMSR